MAGSLLLPIEEQTRPATPIRSVIQIGPAGVSVGMGLSPSPIRRVVALVPVVVVVGLAGCGGGAASTTAAQSGSAAQSVEIKDFAFAPAALTVAKGTTIEFPNEDSTPHTATSKSSGAFDTGTIQPGKSAKLAFDDAGTFAYYCAFHPFMKGTVTVE
jgi:plastocyanin